MSKLLNKLKSLRGVSSEAEVKREEFGKKFYRFSRVLRAFLALLAGTSMIAEYGFYLSPENSNAGNELRVYILDAYFVLSLLQLFFIRHRVEYLKERKGETVLLAFLGLYILFPNLVSGTALYINPNLTPVAITNIYLILSQVFILLALIFNWVRISSTLTNRKLHPPALLVFTFLSLIVLGAVLLSLPKATYAGGMSMIDAFFTSTSAVCVTGLVVVDTGRYFTFTGQLIILFLIQLGGIGIMTLTTFVSFILGNSAQLKHYVTLKDMLDEESTGRIKQTIFIIVLMTLTIEAIGAVSLYKSLDALYLPSSKDRAYFAIFHSVSAFCNAGFSLDSLGLTNGHLASNNFFLFAIMVLIVLGGLGFPVMSNIGKILNPVKQETKILRRLSLHSKVVLFTTGMLTISGAIFVFFLEESNALKSMGFFDKLVASLFQSVTLRTAGFSTVDFSVITIPTLFIMTLYMWIGASPGSTGGGIKTTTFTVAVLNLVSLGRGRGYVELWGREISQIAVIKAFATIILSVFFIAFAQFCMLLTDPDIAFAPLLFEVVSAFSTVGLSTGITASLSSEGKVILIVLMFLGRIGLLTFLFTILRRKSEGKYRYSEENIII